MVCSINLVLNAEGSGGFRRPDLLRATRVSLSQGYRRWTASFRVYLPSAPPLSLYPFPLYPVSVVFFGFRVSKKHVLSEKSPRTKRKEHTVGCVSYPLDRIFKSRRRDCRNQIIHCCDAAMSAWELQPSRGFSRRPGSTRRASSTSTRSTTWDVPGGEQLSVLGAFCAFSFCFFPEMQNAPEPLILAWLVSFFVYWVLYPHRDFLGFSVTILVRVAFLIEHLFLWPSY